MAVRIRLSDGSVYVVGANFKDLNEKIMKALADGDPWIKIMNGNGRMRSINARQIAALEETDEGELTEAESEILQAAQEPQAQTG